MQYGTTYIVRPRMLPRNRSVISPRMTSGSRQLLVGPASSSFAEQMNVRDSTRATSFGSDWARNELGFFASSSLTKVPEATISAVRRSHSAAEPSAKTTRSGWVSSATSAIHASISA